MTKYSIPRIDRFKNSFSISGASPGRFFHAWLVRRKRLVSWIVLTTYLGTRSVPSHLTGPVAWNIHNMYGCVFILEQVSHISWVTLLGGNSLPADIDFSHCLGACQIIINSLKFLWNYGKYVWREFNYLNTVICCFLGAIMNPHAITNDSNIFFKICGRFYNRSRFLN